MLDRVDYLSTVSGGGFTGAMFGRLVAAFGIDGAQQTLARPSSPALDWLPETAATRHVGRARRVGRGR